MSSWVMPKPFNICRWYAQPTAPPATALVLSVGDRTIQIGVFLPHAHFMEQRDGCRHVSDPQLGKLPMADDQGGTWDYTEDQLRLLRIEGLA
jgi:hypothetical protein